MGGLRESDGTVTNTADLPDQAILSFMGPAGGMVSTPSDLMDWGSRSCATGRTSTMTSRTAASR